MISRILAGALLAAALGSPALAQPVLDPVEDLDFDRPEAWAMAYFTSASALTALGPAEGTTPGSVELGAELIWVPSLDAEQRRVGFGGFKEEDINRAPLWARLRVEVGLPGQFKLIGGWIPPVEIDGVEANLISLALERRLLDRAPWSLGARLHAQWGKAKGDLTCQEGGDYLFPAGSPQNPFGCEAPSTDEVEMAYRGAELVLGHQRREDGPAFFAGLGYNRLDNEFQVDARTFGFIDRTLLRSDGSTWTWQLGAELPLRGSFRLAVSALYTALDVTRPGHEQENDPLFHLRALVAYRLR